MLFWKDLEWNFVNIKYWILWKDYVGLKIEQPIIMDLLSVDRHTCNKVLSLTVMLTRCSCMYQNKDQQILPLFIPALFQEANAKVFRIFEN